MDLENNPNKQGTRIGGGYMVVELGLVVVYGDVISGLGLVVVYGSGGGSGGSIWIWIGGGIWIQIGGGIWIRIRSGGGR